MESVQLHLLIFRSHASGKLRLRIANAEKAFGLFVCLFFFLTEVIEKRSIVQMYFTAFNFASFQRHFLLKHYDGKTKGRFGNDSYG